MEEKLQEIEQRFERLTADLGNPEVIGDRSRFSQVAKERSQLEQLVETFREYKRAKVDLEGPEGRRTIAFADLHRLPGDTPHIETTLRPGELVLGFRIAAAPWIRGRRSQRPAALRLSSPTARRTRGRA